MYLDPAGQAPAPTAAYVVDASTHAYGADARFEALDLYVPRGIRSGVIVVYIHGGAWVSRDKSDYASLGAAFARNGVTCAVINYPFAPHASNEQEADDVGASVRWLQTHADAEGRRFVLIGHSAGAQLALYALVGGRVPADAIAGIVAIGAVGINPSTDVELLEPQYQSIYEPPFGSDRRAWEHYDIGSRLRGREPAVLVIHARNDDLAPEGISRQLYDQLRAAGDRVEYLQPADRDHWSVVDRMADPGDPTMQAVLRFLRDLSRTH